MQVIRSKVSSSHLRADNSRVSRAIGAGGSRVGFTLRSIFGRLATYRKVDECAQITPADMEERMRLLLASGF